MQENRRDKRDWDTEDQRGQNPDTDCFRYVQGQ